MFNIQNRRYVGNKNKLMPWISQLIKEHCNGKIFFDVFAGTGATSNYLFNDFNHFILNDFLYSNEIIYKGFFYQEKYDSIKLLSICDKYLTLDRDLVDTNYASENFGDKYFSQNDAKIIGYIRQDIEDALEEKYLNDKEYYILLTSLLYSLDKIANTCGHYDAYIKNNLIDDKFKFGLINPVVAQQKKVEIYREDANKLVKDIIADIAFIDPPYNSRQYSRFYHVLENIAKWDKPTLSGVAMKPIGENISEYCKSNATLALQDLIQNLNAKYIVLTYNNTYNSKSSSSKNKISLEAIQEILTQRGDTQIFDKRYRGFNAGKTDFKEHKEYVFITKVRCYD